MKAKPIVIIDTREQTPFEFEFKLTENSKLDTGDYSIKGFENEFALERKSIGDAVNSVLGERERFEREVERASKLKYFAIIIEGLPEDLKKHVRVNARYHRVPLGLMIGQCKSVVNTYTHWTIKYGIHIFFCKNRKEANHLAEDLLMTYFKYNGGGESNAIN